MLFGTEEDQRRFRTAQNIRLANKEWDKLRAIAREARVNGGNALSVKNQLRAAIAAIGLGGAAAGALTMKAYQYVDNMFSGKRGPDTSSDPPGQKYYRMEGSDYADYNADEQYDTEAMARIGTAEIGDALDNALEMDRQEDEDREFVEYLQNVEGNAQQVPHLRGNVPEQRQSDLVLSVDDQGEEDEASFRNFPEDNDIATQDLEPHPFDQDYSSETITMGDIDMIQPEANALRAGPAGPDIIGTHNSMQVTPISKIPPSFPFHQTEQAILEFHGSTSQGITHLGSSEALRIRMNTYIAPFSETSGTISVAANYEPLTTAAFFNQAVGRYASAPGASGNIVETMYNRDLSDFLDPLFFSGQTNDPYPAGAGYYNKHYNAYTVTKCEWMVRVEFPFHLIKTNYVTDDTPGPAALEDAIIGNTSYETVPLSNVSARVFTNYTMTGDTIVAVNPPVNANVMNMERWDNTYDNKVTVRPNTSKTIRGTWYPGKVKHNPLNDDDMQLWSAAGSVPAQSHLEHLVIKIKEDAHANTRHTNPVTIHGVNIYVNVKWHVQFKERKTELQYPTSNQTNLANTAVNSLVLQNEGFSPQQQPV